MYIYIDTSTTATSEAYVASATSEAEPKLLGHTVEKSKNKALYIRIYMCIFIYICVDEYTHITSRVNPSQNSAAILLENVTR